MLAGIFVRVAFMMIGVPENEAVTGRRKPGAEPATAAHGSSEGAPPPVDQALNDLASSLYEDLRKAARRERRRAGKPLTWNTTALIHETYVKLHRHQAWVSREQFMGFAVTAMRHVLVDAARARLSQKRGGGAVRAPLDAADEISIGGEDREIVRLDEALSELSRMDSQLAHLVECRFFAGLDEVETGKVLGLSDRTVRRRWTQARAWLHREMLAV
jgi:RNA polymerase sigma factor (TIGR02999 family)